MNRARRTALGALVLGGAWLGSQQVYKRLAVGPPDPEYRSVAERLATLPRQRSALRSVGIAYLQGLEHRPTADQIVEEWFPSSEERRRVLGLSPLKLEEEIAERTLHDYRAGRVVSVKGWLLSETEARFAALTTLVRRV